MRRWISPRRPDTAAIRAVDFTDNSDLKTLIAQTGGFFDPRTAIYADVTGDSREEALLPISSGGSLGNVAYEVFTLRDGTPFVILAATRDQTTVGGILLRVEDGTLVRTAGRYGPDDPRCCPSMLVRTTYRWDGKQLQVAKEEEVPGTPNPKSKSE